MMRMTRFLFRTTTTTTVAAGLLIIAATSVSAQQPNAGQQYSNQQNGNRAIPRDQTDPRALQMQQQQAAIQQQRTLQQAAQAQPAQAQPQARVANAANGQPGAVRPVAALGNQPAQRPFPPLNAAEDGRLQKLLNAWEQQSKATKTLTCKYQKWHFDLGAAPAGVHSEKEAGTIKYAAPDQGLFQSDSLLFFIGMKDGKPQYAPKKNAEGKDVTGEYWVCNGREVIQFDANAKKCTITELPAGMQGQQIIESPLPFVFNLDAKKIQQRYWVREVKAPKPGMYLIEAWPKQQADRAQYKLVQIALDDQKFLPKALIMYAPNFNAKTAPMWDHYEFAEVSQNGVRSAMQQFFRNFVPRRPPSDWDVVREKMPAAGQQVQQAQGEQVQRAQAPSQQQLK